MSRVGPGQRIIEQNFQRSVANGTIMVLLQADNMTDPFMRNLSWSCSNGYFRRRT